MIRDDMDILYPARYHGLICAEISDSDDVTIVITLHLEEVLIIPDLRAEFNSVSMSLGDATKLAIGYHKLTGMLAGTDVLASAFVKIDVDDADTSDDDLEMISQSLPVEGVTVRWIGPGVHYYGLAGGSLCEAPDNRCCFAAIVAAGAARGDDNKFSCHVLNDKKMVTDIVHTIRDLPGDIKRQLRDMLNDDRIGLDDYIQLGLFS